jgi:hypothetical protein
MKRDYDSTQIAVSLLVCIASLFVGIVIGSGLYPEPPRFTEKIENVNSVKVLAVDGEVYWVVQEKIGTKTYSIILKPVGKMLEKEGEI